MENYKEELTPIKYGPNALKAASYSAKQGESPFVTHWHDRMELILLRSGVLEVGYGTNVQLLHSNEIYVIPPRTPHAAVCKSEKAHWDVLMFDLRSFYNDVPLCNNILRSIFDGRAKFKMLIKSSEVAECYSRLFSLINQNSFESVAQIYCLIDLLLKHALIEIGEAIKGEHAMNQAAKYIRENLDKELTTKMLSEKFGYCEEHFCRLFKQMTKVTPTSYIKIKRLEKAVTLLQNGDFSVGEVSTLCGFSEPNYFTRCFKAHFGKPPTEYIGHSSSQNKNTIVKAR